MKSLVSSLAALFAVFAMHGQRATVTDEQRGLTIYQIMVASFQHAPDGAEGYTTMWGPSESRKNGNLRGIINALDHISSLGVNAIWLTPVFDSTKAPIEERLQATGYFCNDYFKVDPRFGTEDDLRELIDEAHKRDMYVIFDGVFGHHGGVTEPSPSGHTIDLGPAKNDRDFYTANVAYPGSLDYFKEVATYWIDKFGIDGWRLDQAYQLCQGGHNYWKDIRKAVEDLCEKRRAAGERWGTLGFMVGEDWGDAATINRGVFSQNGLVSAMDFDGKDRISGPMQELTSEGLRNGWDDVIMTLSSPRRRGYATDSVAPTLFLTNHDGYRLADHFDPADEHYYEKQMARMAILAAYNGPISIYYGDEYADRSAELTGAQKDNISRTSGHLDAHNGGEQRLRDYTAEVMNLRRQNPALWRGETQFVKQAVGDAQTLTVIKTDPETGNKVLIVFSDTDTTVPVRGHGGVDVDAWRPEFVILH